mmetsp:Transcript_16099/g.28941  ORF Transcript_16099/g.28941 Transcript_16099/m.28941 type:complete len:206 (+) Transcript_16099:198-815(+)
MGQAICCKCFSAPLQFMTSNMQMHSTPAAVEDGFSEASDLLDEENYRSALAYSEEHIQVLVDHQMSKLADRLAALDSEMLNTPSSEYLKGNGGDSLLNTQHFSTDYQPRGSIDDNFVSPRDDKDELLDSLVGSEGLDSIDEPDLLGFRSQASGASRIGLKGEIESRGDAADLLGPLDAIDDVDEEEDLRSLEMNGQHRGAVEMLI